MFDYGTVRPRAQYSTLLATSLLLALSGCSSCSNPAELASITLPGIVKSVKGDQSALVEAPDAPLGQVELYVDLSRSMQPYIVSSGSLPALLTHLDGSLAGKLRLFGFGFVNRQAPQEATSTPLGPLLQPDTYNRLNNDYAALFNTFHDTKATRLVISDGVQSDPTAGARYGDVVRAAQAHIERGGVFGTLVLKGAYRGAYFTEGGACPNQTVVYTCDDRPYVIYVFAASAAAFDAVLAHMKPDFAPLLDVRTGADPSVSIRPVEEALPVGQGRRARSERVLSDLDTLNIPGLRTAFTARVRAKAADDNRGFAPLQFDLVPTPALASALGPDGLKSFLEGLHVDVRGWALTKGRKGAPARADSLGRPQTLPATIMVRKEGARTVARLIVPTKRPENGKAKDTRTLAWLITLRPGEAQAQRLIPAALSTPDDCTAQMCPRILNLRPMLGAVLNDNYIPGRVLLVTSWR